MGNCILKNLLSVFILCLFVILPLASCKAEEKKKIYCFSQTVDYINPVLAGVESVVIAVNVAPNSARTSEAQAALPKPLRKDSLEKLLKELYTQRFSTDGGRIMSTATPGCHDKKDQPVTVIDYNTNEGRKKVQELAKKDGVLVVYFQAMVFDGDRAGMKKDQKVMTAYLSRLRAEEEVSDFDELTNAVVFPSYVNQGVLEKRIKSYIKRYVN